MQLSEIVTIVNGYLLDEVASTSTLVPDFTNKAIYDAERRGYNFKHMETTLAVTTVEDTQVLASRPALWKRGRLRPSLSRFDGGRKELDWTDEQEAWRWYPLATAPTTDNGQPEVILVTETELLVYPEPDGESDWADGDYRLVIPYYARSADLADDADTNWWTINAPWYVIFQAVSTAMVRNREEQRAGMYAQLAEKEYQTARRQDLQMKLPERLTLVPRRGAFARVRKPRRL